MTSEIGAFTLFEPTTEAQCRACGAQVVWTITPQGNRAPINYHPADNGTILVMSPHGYGERLSIVLSGPALERARAHALPLHTSHFADCPKAEEFRRRPTAPK